MAQFDKIVYIFGDSSVPPPYHRSYTITLQEGKGTIRIYDYEKDLVSESFEISIKEWEDLKEKAVKLKDKGKKIAEGATGTRTYTIQLYQGEEQQYQFIWDSLSEAHKTTLGFVELIQKTVKPSLQELKEKTK